MPARLMSIDLLADVGCIILKNGASFFNCSHIDWFSLASQLLSKPKNNFGNPADQYDQFV